MSSIKVFDFFSGCGGTSSGFRSAGYDVVYALDNDELALDSYKANFPNTHTELNKIQNVDVKSLKQFMPNRKDPILFCGCAPCQPFSQQNNNKFSEDPRRNLLSEFSRFVKYWKPEYILVENVPGLQKLKSEGPFDKFTKQLKRIGYNVSYEVIPASGFGVPQRRERLVLLASLIIDIKLPELTHGPNKNLPCSTVKDWIYNLPKLDAGETSQVDPDHRAAKLSPLNLKRIKHTPEGGSRESWPEELWLDCHKNYNGHTDVYGRLSWDKPASSLTTKCTSLSNGRFGHPEEDRAISIREAACLQTFPRNYKFKGGLQSKSRQIGNAVPPLMAQRIAESILEQHNSGT